LLSALEERERRGYEAQPQQPEEYLPWEKVAVWPDDALTYPVAEKTPVAIGPVKRGKTRRQSEVK